MARQTCRQLLPCQNSHINRALLLHPSVSVCVCICVYIYIYIYIHTHICTASETQTWLHKSTLFIIEVETKGWDCFTVGQCGLQGQVGSIVYKRTPFDILHKMLQCLHIKPYAHCRYCFHQIENNLQPYNQQSKLLDDNYLININTFQSHSLHLIINHEEI